MVQVRVPRPALLLSQRGQLGLLCRRVALEEGVSEAGAESALVAHVVGAEVHQLTTLNIRYKRQAIRDVGKFEEALRDRA